MTVSVICEECGKVYHVPIAKLDQIKGDVVKTKCKDCGHIIQIEKQTKEPEETQEYDSLAGAVEEDFDADGFDKEDFDDLEKAFQKSAQEAADDFDDEDFDDLEKAFQESALEVAEEVDTAPQQTAGVAKKKTTPKKGKMGMGLRIKMIFLFMVVPLLLMSLSGFLTQRRLNLLTNDVTTASANIVKQMGEANIAAIGESVAAQCKLYLDSHPDLKREDFASDPVLSKLAIQKVGKTGYTVLSSVGPFTAWVHPNPKINGVVLNKVIKKLLGKDFPRFARIIAAADKGKNTRSRGYYLWKDKDGQMREKFMTLTPVAGTEYSIAATTYIHEFTRPLENLNEQADAVASDTRNLNLITIVGTLLIIGLIVTFYGHALVSKIRHLTDVADRISVGELDAEISIKSKDEIGNLADAIARMQDSLRLSIERLRKRR